MAEMIPDRLPSSASAGEKKVFALLQTLPDDVIVYYEPVVADRYPDFIVIMPSVGLLVIEVKGWYPTHIVKANNVNVVINSRSREENFRHPIRQARDYQHHLMDAGRRHTATAALLQSDGQHTGKFIFPFGHIAILNNCTRQQLEERGLSDVFPVKKVFARDELEALPSDNLIDGLKTCFDPWWVFGRLSDSQVAILRSVIHPEIVISTPVAAGPAAEEHPLAVLDLRQERNAHSVGEGHRIIYGVAGSGKTVILVARARLVAQDINKQVLVLCYNRALGEHFQRLFVQTSNVTCLHFHQWGSQRNSVRFEEDEERFGERLLQRLRHGDGEAQKYDAVFIDEAQDFARSWFQCSKLALKEPDDGDLLIVGDGTQLLYRRRKFTWREAGINAQGRTINTRFDLDRNYRNTREIIKLAGGFVSVDGDQNDPDAALQIIKPNPDVALRSGPTPEMITASNTMEELRLGVSKINDWLKSGLKPSEIAVLYRANTQGWVRDLASALSKSAPVYWSHGRNEGFTDQAGVCITTMHSAKGLQWRAVLIMRSDMMPFMPDREADAVEQERLERGLMYVAMTRAEEMLAFTRSGLGGFASRIQQLLDHGGPAKR